MADTHAPPLSPQHQSASATPPHLRGSPPQARQPLPASAPPLAEGLHPLTEAVACLPADATQTLDQSADGGGAGGCVRPGQPIQQVVRELHEEVCATGGRQVAQCPDGPLAHGQAWAAQLRQQTVQEAGMEGTQRGTQPGESEGMSDGAHPAGSLGQAPLLSPSSPGLLPRIMTTQWPLVNGKVPCNCVE